MCKTEIFQNIISVVSEETEVPVCDILSASKVTEVVDARAITAILLVEYGFYPSQIAKMMSKAPACIRHLTSSFESRKENNKMIEIFLQSIRNKLKK